MNPLLQDYIQEYHHQELLREAENYRLARQVEPSDTFIRKIAGRALLWIGSRSIELSRRVEPGLVISTEPAANGGCA